MEMLRQQLNVAQSRLLHARLPDAEVSCDLSNWIALPFGGRIHDGEKGYEENNYRSNVAVALARFTWRQ